MKTNLLFPQRLLHTLSYLLSNFLLIKGNLFLLVKVNQHVFTKLGKTFLQLFVKQYYLRLFLFLKHRVTQVLRKGVDPFWNLLIQNPMAHLLPYFFQLNFALVVIKPFTFFFNFLFNCFEVELPLPYLFINLPVDFLF